MDKSRLGPLAAMVVVVACLPISSAAAGPASVYDSRPDASPALVHASKHRAHCHGVRATKVGNRKNNVIIGTKHRDVIVAKGGRDQVFGRGGRDLICGGKGADLLDAMKGHRERIYGESGLDYCTAPASEHRFHHGCEVHLGAAHHHGDPGRTAPKAPPHLAQTTAARPVDIDLVSQRSKRAFQGLYPGTLNCNDNLLTTPQADQPLVTGGGGGFPNPTLVDVQRFFYEWTSQGWVDRGLFDEKQWNVPNDGAAYAVPSNDQNYDPGTYAFDYAVWWWDGTQWHGPNAQWVLGYTLFGLQADWCTLQ